MLEPCFCTSIPFVQEYRERGLFFSIWWSYSKSVFGRVLNFHIIVLDPDSFVDVSTMNQNNCIAPFVYLVELLKLELESWTSIKTRIGFK